MDVFTLFDQSIFYHATQVFVVLKTNVDAVLHNFWALGYLVFASNNIGMFRVSLIAQKINFNFSKKNIECQSFML